MKDNRIYNALNIVAYLLSELHNVPLNNFDYEDGKCICLECKKEWYDKKHQMSDCKSIKLDKLYQIAISFDEG